MTTGESSALGMVGKVPWSDEYVRFRVEGEPFLAFDGWLTDNVEWAGARAGAGWPLSYRAGQVNAFVFRPADATKPILAGAITPSADGAGREFPLAIVASIQMDDGLMGSPQALPIVLKEFWQLTSELAVKSLGGIDFDRDLAFARAAAATSLGEALAWYEDWVRTMPLADLSLLVFGDAGVTVVRAVRVVLAAVGPYCNVERPKTPLTLRLPLGASGGAAVCFWIDFVKRAARWTSTIPSFFWSHDGNAGTMLLHLGDPPRSTLAQLWMPTGDRDEFCDLAPPIGPEQVERLPELPPSVARLFAEPGHSVYELLLAIHGK